MQLAKSSYIAGLQCTKQLWLRTNRPDLLREASAAQRRIVQQGYKIGELARQEFGSGHLVNSHGKHAVAETRCLLDRGSAPIFEATFVADSMFVRCDVLVRSEENRWTLIEVKSSTTVKPHHVHDLAIQYHVVSQCGLAIDRMLLMYVDKSQAVGRDYRPMFVYQDVTAQVHALAAETRDNVAMMHAVVQSPTAPEIDVGAHCRSPYPCPFHDYCWSSVPDTSIQFIPRLTAQQRADLAERAIHDINQLDSEVHLSPSQSRYVSCVQRGEDVINYDAVKEFQVSLSYPIHFFDFETDGSPTPHISGVRPYQQVPFQYSCHVLGADGSLTHVDYLHEKTSDPRPDLISALRRDVADHGTIVVYNAQFERKVLLELAAFFPNDAPFLQSLARRLSDQLDVFRKHYTSPAFRGSNSLKRILMVIHPEADYSDLAVRKGDDAQAVWTEMIHTDAGPEKRQMSEDLRAYCQRDTYAMVLIHNHLSELVASSVP